MPNVPTAVDVSLSVIVFVIYHLLHQQVEWHQMNANINLQPKQCFFSYKCCFLIVCFTAGYVFPEAVQYHNT